MILRARKPSRLKIHWFTANSELKDNFSEERVYLEDESAAS